MTAKVNDAWRMFHDAVSYRIGEIPRPVGALLESPDATLNQRLAAVTSAFHCAGSFLVAWQRLGTGGAIDTFVGGSSLVDSSTAPGSATALSLPAGGRGRYLPPGAVATALSELPHWTRITIVTDALLAEAETPAEPAQSTNQARPSLEDCLLAVWPGPFAWLVFAEAVSVDELDMLAARTGDDQRRAKARAGSSPDYAVQAGRLEHRHRELSQAAATGLWRAHFLAGGADPSAARRVAGLLCASADLEGLPYALVPGAGSSDLESVMSAQPLDAAAGSELVSSALLARIAKPPAAEVPGVRFRLRGDFDVTPESPDGRAWERDGSDCRETDLTNGAVPLGEVIDRNQEPAGPLSLSQTSLNRHTFVCGATGAGKSQTVRGLLEACTHAGLPWLVIEPAKAEYRLMAARLGSDVPVRVIRPGDPDAPPAGLNPLEPAVDAAGRRFPLQTHVDLVRSLFVAAFEAVEPFPQVLSAALNRCYEDLGWDLVLGEPVGDGASPRYPTLGDLQRTAERVVNEIGYGKEITDNVRGFIAVRLSSLRLGTTGRFFEGGHQIDLDELLRSNVVFEIEDVGDDRDRAFLMGTVLVRLVEHLRLRQRQEPGATTPLRHISVFEEAHRLLRNTEEPGPAAHAVEMFAGLLAEIRAYGEGLVIAEQIPSKLVPDVIKNTAVKIVHRLPALDDREAVGATMNITDEQSSYVVTLPPGQAAVFSDGMDFPLLVTMPDGTAREDGRAVVPAGVADLITPRSETCGVDCAVVPCTLRQIRVAHHALRADPRLVIWAELAVVAHLTGWTTPVPRAPLLDDLRAMDPRSRDCALSHAVDAAAAARSTVITSRVAPAELATHVVDAFREHVATGHRHIGEEPAWLAPAYRWCYVWDTLTTASNDDAEASRHPRTDDWEGEYDRTIPGATVREQLDAVTRWFDNDQRDPVVLRTVAYGAAPTPAVATAVGVPPDHPDWTERLTEQLDQFIQCRWPLRYLTGNATT